MASTDDVASYLAGRVSDAVYPGGSGLPGIINAAVKIYPGWPAPGTLQQDINSGGVHVSIWPLPAERKISTALGRPFRVMAKDKPALQFIVNGSVIDVSGVADALTSVRVSLKGKTFTFTFRAGTTADQAVTALGAALPESFTVLSSVFIPLADHISVSATTAGTAVKELHRQIKDFQVTVWAPTPGLRDRTGSAIDAALSEQSHIDLNDGAPAQLLYVRQFDSDRSENWHVYRRDLIFSVNYATTRTITAPEVTQFEVTLNGHQTTR